MIHNYQVWFMCQKIKNIQAFIYNTYSSKYIFISMYSNIFLSSLVNSINEEGISCTTLSSKFDSIEFCKHIYFIEMFVFLKHFLIILSNENIFLVFLKLGQSSLAFFKVFFVVVPQPLFENPFYH